MTVFDILEACRKARRTTPVREESSSYPFHSLKLFLPFSLSLSLSLSHTHTTVPRSHYGIQVDLCYTAFVL
jgi:hypothetical protein